MQTRFKIEVTEKDIAKAHKNDSYTCVVSQALARTIKDATRIDVDSQSIRFTLDGTRLLYLTPYAVQGYVIAFDAGDPIEPFSFCLRNPQKARRIRETADGTAVRRSVVRAKRKARSAGGAPADVKAAAKAAYVEAKKTHGGQASTTEPGRKMPPKVFKLKHRSYGHRLLRINKSEAAPATP